MVKINIFKQQKTGGRVTTFSLQIRVTEHKKKLRHYFITQFSLNIHILGKECQEVVKYFFSLKFRG